MRWLSFVLAVSAALFPMFGGSPTTVAAQEDDAYRELVHDAVEEHAAGHYAEARALFRRAHQRSPNARTLRGIGMSNFELRQYAATIVAMEAALAETRRPLTDGQREGARDLIERSQAFVARYTLLPAGAATAVRVDGVAAVVDSEGELLVDLGTHEIRVTCDGCSTEPRRVRVVGGERAELDFTASSEAPEPGTEPTDPDPVGAGTGPTDPEPRADDGLSGTSIALFVGAAAAGAGAIGTGFWWRDRNGEIDACDARSDCLNRDRLTTERNATMGVTLGLSVAAVALLTVGLLTMGGDDDEDGRAVRCVPAGMGMACAGTF